jgi:AraC-like DNA-binding protein
VKASIAALISNHADRTVLGSAGRQEWEAVFISAADDMLAEPRRRWAALVYEVESWESGAPILPNHAMGAARRIPIILRYTLRPSLIHAIATVTRAVPRARLSLRGWDDVVLNVSQALSAPDEQTPHSPILGRIEPILPNGVLEIGVGAIHAGTGKCSVANLARLCNLPVRTLEWRLKRARMPQARVLLAWICSLNATWDLDVRGWSVKRVATELGFATRTAFSNYIVRNVQSSPAQLQRDVGFGIVLDRFVRTLGLS